MKQKQALTQREINESQLTEILLGIKGAKFMTVTTNTEPSMRKTNNPFSGQDVRKISTNNITVNFDYGKSLQKKGGTPSDKGRTWGSRVGKTSFIQHKGGLYVQAKLNAKPQKVVYTLDGTEMTPEQLTALQPFLSHRAAQLVPIIDVGVQNIKELKIDKQHFIVK